MPAVFNNLFNKGKVKSWIRKTHKRQSFAYGHGYITDGHVLLVDEPHMHSTILEIFGTLTPECRYSEEQFQRLIDLPNEPIEVIDSQLELILEPKYRLRIFYDPKTGRELVVDSVYFDLLDNPRACAFCTNDTMSMLWIMCGNEIVEVVAPFRLYDQLSHIRFKVEEEVVKATKEQKMRKEARERIIECLKDGYTGYYCDLHHKVFNTDYYIIGTNEAKEALKEYDVFKAIEKVQTYEKENFGEAHTDLSNPEKLINMLFYIIGEQVLYELMDGSDTWNRNWNKKATGEINAEILEELGE